MTLSAGLLLMADKVFADKGDKGGGSATDLSGVTQNWDKNLPSTSRFIVLAAFANQAVRDNETGLVWEKALQTDLETWESARHTCATKNVGGRKGWRLPSIPELASLIDPSVAPGLPLPSGHPFLNVRPAIYWSASTDTVTPTNAWIVIITDGSALSGFKSSAEHTWCVRGGMNTDVY